MVIFSTIFIHKTTMLWVHTILAIGDIAGFYCVQKLETRGVIFKAQLSNFAA